MKKEKKTLSNKQLNLIYTAIIFVSVVLIVSLISIFAVSKIKNNKLQNDFIEANKNFQEVKEDSELSKDPNYQEARTKDIIDEKGETIYIKKI